MLSSRQMARSAERKERDRKGGGMLAFKRGRHAPMIDECLDMDEMGLEMSHEIGEMGDQRSLLELEERLRDLAGVVRFTDTHHDEQERTPRQAPVKQFVSRKELLLSLPDKDIISEKIFSLQREGGNWEISDLSVISFYLHMSTEQILEEIAESGAKSLGTSVYSKLLHFIPTLILLFFLHTAYPQSFEMSPSFISWTVIPPKWKSPGDKALSFLRLFNKQNPSLSSRLDLGTSWYQYAEKRINNAL
eukprot:TRINITY_DN1161_c0_g1_i7.p1 TRINITY_DN1161_c0_g1~~TRINITY_DN1161_c0_g1_i7.p1  ORF type:complete len:247 (-),score=65.49 TRINITY_DN1161_c0_g1_i7:213-953(-)